MKIIFSVLFLFFTGISVFCQNLIGLNENEIRSYMKENYKDMSNANVVNNRFKYLKYSDSSESQTLLFFLSSESVCRSVRLICDKSLIPQKIKEFNTMYTKSGDNSWIDKKNGVNYIIRTREEEWSYIVSIETDK